MSLSLSFRDCDYVSRVVIYGVNHSRNISQTEGGRGRAPSSSFVTVNQFAIEPVIEVDLSSSNSALVNELVVEEFCFPDGVLLLDSPPVSYFGFWIGRFTDSKGNKYFGYMCQGYREMKNEEKKGDKCDIYSPVVVCVISVWPFLTAFKKTSAHILHLFLNGNMKPLCELILYLLHGVPSPGSGIKLSLSFDFNSKNSLASNNRFSSRLFALPIKSSSSSTKRSCDLCGHKNLQDLNACLMCNSKLENDKGKEEGKEKDKDNVPSLYISSFRSSDNDLPSGYPLSYLFSCVEVKHVLRLLSCLVCDARVLVCSSSKSLVSVCCESLLDLLYPITYTPTYIPLLTKKMITNLEACGSFFFGCKSSYLDDSIKDIMGDLVILDLDSGELHLPSSAPPSMPIEISSIDRLGSLVKEYLHPELHRLDAVTVEVNEVNEKDCVDARDIRKFILELWVKILGSYVDHISSDTKRTFNAVDWISSFPVPSHPFYLALTSSQSFTSFLEERHEVKFGCPILFDFLVKGVEDLSTFKGKDATIINMDFNTNNLSLTNTEVELILFPKKDSKEEESTWGKERLTAYNRAIKQLQDRLLCLLEEKIKHYNATGEASIMSVTVTKALFLSKLLRYEDSLKCLNTIGLLAYKSVWRVFYSLSKDKKFNHNDGIIKLAAAIGPVMLIMAEDYIFSLDRWNMQSVVSTGESNSNNRYICPHPLLANIWGSINTPLPRSLPKSVTLMCIENEITTTQIIMLDSVWRNSNSNNNNHSTNILNEVRPWQNDSDRILSSTAVVEEISMFLSRIIFSLYPLFHNTDKVKEKEMVLLSLLLTRPVPYGLPICSSLTYRAVKYHSCFKKDTLVDYLIASDVSNSHSHAVSIVQLLLNFDYIEELTNKRDLTDNNESIFKLSALSLEVRRRKDLDTSSNMINSLPIGLFFGNFKDEVPVFDVNLIDNCMKCDRALSSKDKVTDNCCGCCGKVLCTICSGENYVVNNNNNKISKLCFYCKEKSSRVSREREERRRRWSELPVSFRTDYIKYIYSENEAEINNEDEEIVYRYTFLDKKKKEIVRQSCCYLDFLLSLSKLQGVNIAFSNDNEKKCFWINVLNILLFHARLHASSTTTPTKIYNSNLLKEYKYNIGGKYYTASDVIAIISKIKLESGDQRLDFAICMGYGDNHYYHFYNPINIDKELDYVCSNFCNSTNTKEERENAFCVPSLPFELRPISSPQEIIQISKIDNCARIKNLIEEGKTIKLYHKEVNHNSKLTVSKIIKGLYVPINKTTSRTPKSNKNLRSPSPSSISIKNDRDFIDKPSTESSSSYSVSSEIPEKISIKIPSMFEF